MVPYPISVVCPVSFVCVGHGYYMCANKIKTITRTGTAQAERVKLNAKQEGRYLDYTHGHATKTYITLDDETVVGSALSPQTIFKRSNECFVKQYDIGEDEQGRVSG